MPLLSDANGPSKLCCSMMQVGPQKDSSTFFHILPSSIMALANSGVKTSAAFAKYRWMQRNGMCWDPTRLDVLA